MLSSFSESHSGFCCSLVGLLFSMWKSFFDGELTPDVNKWRHPWRIYGSRADRWCFTSTREGIEEQSLKNEMFGIARGIFLCISVAFGKGGIGLL